MQLIKCRSSGWNTPFGNSCPRILLVLYLVVWDVTPGGSWTLALCHISPALLCFVVVFSHWWDPRLSFRLENGNFFSFKTENYAFFPLKEVYWFSFGNHWLHTALPIATGALIFSFLFSLYSFYWAPKLGVSFWMSTVLKKNSLNNLELVLIWKCISNNSRPWASVEGKKKNKKTREI